MTDRATMKRCAALVLSLLLVPLARSSASDIDRYLETSTAVVVHVDVTQLDVPALLEFAQAQFPGAIPDQGTVGSQALLSGILQTLRGAGVTQIYATLSTLEFTNGQMAVIVPAQNPERLVAQLEDITAMLPGSLGYKVHAGQGAVLVTTDLVWQRLASVPSAQRPELSSAIESIASQPMGLAFNVRNDLRNAIAEMFPDSLPPSLMPFKLSPKQLVHDVASVQLTLQVPPKFQLQLAAACVDAASAQRTAALATDLLKQLNIENLQVTAAEKNATATAAAEQLEQLLDSVMRPVAAMHQSNRIKQVALAMHRFESNYRHMPPRMTVSEQGQPLLSWRVFLLPYLGELALYNAFHLDEPWDSPHNRTLVERMPQAYRSPQFKDLPAGHTLIQLPLLPGSIWAGSDNRFLRRSELRNSGAATVNIVMAPEEKAVIWTKPEDLTLRPEALAEDLFGNRPGCPIAMFDGSVQELPRTVDAARLKPLLTGAE